MFDIRKVGIESLDQLVSLWVETFRQAYDGVHSTDSIDAYCAKNYSKEVAREVLLSDQIACVMAYQDNQPVGFYVLKHHACPIALAGESSELKQIYILSSVYGTGLGKTLFDHASEIARKSNKKWLWLCVSDINYRAQSFYQKLGGQAMGTGPVLEVGSDQLTSTVMVFEL